jgi:hypothetical protein
MLIDLQHELPLVEGYMADSLAKGDAVNHQRYSFIVGDMRDTISKVKYLIEKVQI